MKPLEFKFRPPNIDSLKASGIKEVMILGGGAYECDEPHLCSWHVKDPSTMRLAAGLEIAALLGDDARIICTGGGLGIPEAEYMKNLILVFQPQRIVFADNEARRTIDHAQSAIKYLQDKKFVLVSSAYLLPRAVKVFSGIGYHPIPFPVDYQFNDKTTFLQFFPSTEMLYKTHKAVNEYFAMIIYLISRS